MDFDLSPEHQAFRKVVRDFAEAEIAPHTAAWDEAHHFPVDVVQKMGELGLFGLVFPAEWGGGDGDFASLCIAIEEIGRIDQSLGITLSAGVGLGANPIFRFGDDDQKARWLPDLVAGRALGAFGLTEPDAGSDAGATRTRARLVDDHWVIDGSKAFITNSGTPITSIITVTARTDEGISSFVVQAGTPGLIVEPAYRKLGWHASDTHGLTLDGCARAGRPPARQPRRRVPQLPVDPRRRPHRHLGAGARLRPRLPRAVARVRQGAQRVRGPIGRNQAIAFALADLDVAVENAANLTYKAAWMKDQGRPFTHAAAIAKLYSTEAAVTATRVATQVFGGSGFIEENPIARFYRDAKILEIGEGTSEMQRLVIARSLGLPVS